LASTGDFLGGMHKWAAVVDAHCGNLKRRTKQQEQGYASMPTNPSNTYNMPTSL